MPEYKETDIKALRITAHRADQATLSSHWYVSDKNPTVIVTEPLPQCPTGIRVLEVDKDDEFIAEYIAAIDPNTILNMCNEIEELRELVECMSDPK